MNHLEENGGRQKNPKVLIVEERQDAAAQISLALEKRGANVLPVQSNSFAVLDILRRGDVDLLMMDLFLGGMDGIALLQEIHALKLNDPPIIVLVTPMDSELIINVAAKLGASYVFLRPIDSDFLAKRALEVYHEATEYSIMVIGQRFNVKDVRMEIVRALREIGIPSNLLGYQFLCTGIFFVISQNGFRREVTTRVYPYVAKMHGSTPQKVERSMRHAIEATWSRGDINSLHRIFGNTVARSSGRPTNSEFLARVTDYVLTNLSM